ncbi:MAG: hypothetical protein J7578_17180 [Chitinophagaceae bacterium]|nr:hypothetical protein [Chitinophagaceae bacterium]
MSKPRKKYFIQEHLQEPYLNGGIGYTDIERILQSEGYQPIFFPCHYSYGVIAKIRRALYLLKLFFFLPSGSLVIFLHPQYATMNKTLVRLLGKRKSIKRVAVIGDINGLRHGNKAILQQELALFAGYDHLIVHNPKMKKWMEEQIPSSSISVLHFFDFLTEPKKTPAVQNTELAYAGNLAESPFLERLNELLPQNEGVLFKVYGQPYSPRLQEQRNLEYMGVSEPYGLPAKLEGAYGLIWDGNGLEAAEDSIADYLNYISPHKASLYILSGIPLILGRDAGIADLVQEHGIGILLDNLHDIKQALAAVSTDEYQAMCANCRELAKQIASGACTKQALLEMQKALG